MANTGDIVQFSARPYWWGPATAQAVPSMPVNGYVDSVNSDGTLNVLYGPNRFPTVLDQVQAAVVKVGPNSKATVDSWLGRAYYLAPNPFAGGGPLPLSGIGFRTAASAGGSGASAQVAVPVGVAAGDYVLVFALGDNAGGTEVVTASSTGTAPAALGATLTADLVGPGLFVNARAFGFFASGTDAGQVVTLTSVSGHAYDWNLQLVAYYGCAASPVDVYATAAGTPSLVGGHYEFASPTGSTARPGEWAVSAFAGSHVSGAGAAGGPYPTVRTSTGVMAVTDSNGLVGPAGTSVGNGSWLPGAFTPSAAWTLSLF